jgi:predicted acylesterase/phospholipase RssA/CRP-like cAMP-binding protein
MFYHLPSRRCRCDWRVLANARLDRALYAAGRLDRTVPFHELHRIAYSTISRTRPPRWGSETAFCANLKGNDMSDDIIPLLKVHDYFRGASEEALQEVVQHARVDHYSPGTVVHEANVPLTSVGFVLRGRLKAVRVDSRGGESLFRMFDRGEQFGMMVGALAEPVPVRVIALEHASILSLEYEAAMELTFRHADLRRLWLKTYAGSVRKLYFGSAPRQAPMMLALIHESPATRAAAKRLVDRLRDVGERLAVFSDLDKGSTFADVRFRSLYADGRPLELEEVRRQVAEWQDAHRIIFDVTVDLNRDWGERLMELVDRAIYYVPVAAVDASVRRLRSYDVSARGWRDKISIAWLLEGDSPVAPAVPDLKELACRDFKIAETPPKLPMGRSLGCGIERLVHDLRGVRIGVALGGGAARGMSHLGVLKALEQNGIVADMIAGTSAGAMTGILYASGFDGDYCANQFAADLQPSWIFRQLPRGKYWYLLYKYRRGQFDPMLRKYLHDWKLEQLSIPCFSVTVDLVSGNAVVRERGDAVHAILESINLPVLSVPIVRGGQVLIDGGLVNNIPADVLVSLGCNFVIAVSVSAKIEKEFCHVTADTQTPPRKGPAVIQTILRSLLVQNYSLNDIGVQPADVVIEPDVTGIDMTEFMRAKELASIGEAAAMEQVPRIQKLLNRLDPHLFRPAGDSRDPQRS